jgi:hypothetical protein
MSTYPRTIVVLGTARDVGKTITSLGIIGKLLSPEQGYRLDEIGYIKPVGQQTLTVDLENGERIEADKDAVVITSLMGTENPGFEYISPVIWRGGLTATFIEQAAKGDPVEGQRALLQRIREAYEKVAEGKRVVVVEGTGQPGVGSVAGVSNADVINMLREIGAPVFVILVTGGGIGSTIDEIWPYLMAMGNMRTRVDGIVINGVIPDKVDKIRHYLETYYDKIFVPLYGNCMCSQPVPPIIGYVPTIPELALPTMRLIVEDFLGERDSDLQIIAPPDFNSQASRLVKDVKVINLRYGYERFVMPGDVVVAGINANDSVLSVVMHHQRLISQQGNGLSGLILSCRQVGGLSQQVLNELLTVQDLPTVALDYDTAEVIQRIEKLSVKMQPYDTYKRDLISEVYKENIMRLE